MALRGLPEAAVARFLPPQADVAPAALRGLHERTAGNPFFLRELVRLLDERGALGGDGAALPALIPDRVREVVGRRLEPLEPTTREVLAIAGVVGRPFTIAGLARVGGLQREAVAQALQPALDGRLVEPRADAPGRFGFSHAIVRDAVYDELPPALRARLHAAAATILRESLEAGGEATAAEAAQHALAAARCGADPQPAWELSREAAREAAALQAHAEAAAHYAGALEALELGAEAAPAERLETALARASATFAAGDIDAARGRFRAVAAAARRSGAAEVHARAALGFSEVVMYGADRHRGDRAARRDARAAAARGQRAAGASVGAARPAARTARPTSRAAQALIEKGVAMARRAGDSGALVSVLATAALFNRSPGDDEACIAAADEVIAMSGRGADLASIFWARVARLRELLEAGRIEAVDRELEQLERLGADSRRTYYRWSVLVLQAARAIFAGRLADGERLAEEAIALNRRHGEDADQEYTVQRLALSMLGGRPQDAPLAALREYAARYPQLPVWEAMLARAELALSPRPRAGRARALRGRRLRHADGHRGVALRRRAPRRAGRGAGDAGPDRAARRRARAARRAERGDGRRVGGVRARGAVAGDAGERRRAARRCGPPLRRRGRAGRRVGRGRLGAGGDRRLAARTARRAAHRTRCGRARWRSRATRAALARRRAESDDDAVAPGLLRARYLGRHDSTIACARTCRRWRCSPGASPRSLSHS